MNRYYTGVGSRKTPLHIQKLMMQFASMMAEQGWTLRSGAAEGADAAFELGCDACNGKKEIFLPWQRFNDHSSPLYEQMEEAYILAASAHKAWDKCGRAVQKLHARNVHQVLGKDLMQPSKMLICWTPNGEAIGGTATAIHLAQANGIRAFNLGKDDHFQAITKMIKEYSGE